MASEAPKHRLSRAALSRARRWTRKRWWLAAAILAGAAAAVAYLATRGDDKPAQSYATIQAQRGPVRAEVSATGTLAPVVEVQVGSQVSGRIKALYADYNSVVTKGQVIAELDPQLFETAVEQATANLAAARASLAKARAEARNARAQYNRIKALTAQGVTPQAEADAALAAERVARAQITSSRAAIAQAEAALSQAKVNLTYTTIRSPIDGVVVSRSVDVGQTVAASLQAPVLFRIAENLREMEVHTSVAESDVGQLRVNMRAEFSVDAYPERKFVGSVRQVRLEATTISNVVTYDAVLRVDNADQRLRPGMTASVTFVVAERKNATLVPNTALRFTPRSAGAPATRSKGHRLWLLRKGAPVAVPVRLGITDGEVTEIVSGIEPGDVVIVGTNGGKQPKGRSGRRRWRPPRVL